MLNNHSKYFCYLTNGKILHFSVSVEFKSSPTSSSRHIVLQHGMFSLATFHAAKKCTNITCLSLRYASINQWVYHLQIYISWKLILKITSFICTHWIWLAELGCTVRAQYTFAWCASAVAPTTREFCAATITAYTRGRCWEPAIAIVKTSNMKRVLDISHISDTSLSTKLREHARFHLSLGSFRNFHSLSKFIKYNINKLVPYK